jgi:hypothetical protein
MDHHSLEFVCSNIFSFCAFGSFLRNSFILLDTPCELLYFSSALRLAVIGQTEFHFKNFKPVTYWQTASNCLQSRQGPQTVSIRSARFRGRYSEFWRERMAYFGPA